MPVLDISQAAPVDISLWREVWADGLADQLPTDGLIALRDALVRDDPRLLQGATCQPSAAYRSTRHLHVECACPVAYTLWRTGFWTVGSLERAFHAALMAADREIGRERALSSFLCWCDDTPRDAMREQLLDVVEATILTRVGNAGCPPRPAVPVKPAPLPLPF